MKLTFLGATHEVTGSCYYLETGGHNILIDYGMEQGPDCFENQPVPVCAGDIDIVLLTHAHIDHSGRLPLLSKEGFSGQIFATEGTEELCKIMLQDSAHIQEFEAEWRNRKAERAGKELIEPLYTTQDAQNAIKCFVGMRYGEERYITDGVRIRFTDAGHLLGSASIELWIREGDVEKKLVFSGDIGNVNQPLLRDPSCVEGADYVVMESTYGDRDHEKPADYAAELAKVLQKTFDRGGNVVIPSFAVGRTQEMLYFIRQIKEKGMVKGHDGFPVYVDSPLAVEATTVFQKRMFFDFDEEATKVLQRGVNPIGFDGLRVSVSSEDSKQINFNSESKVILSASGMCDAGRIKHHLKHNLYRPESTVLFVGYQAVGTVGRALVEGAEKVKLFNEEISVKAEILRLPGISGHADRKGLLGWISELSKAQRPEMVFVTHGDDTVCEHFREQLEKDLGLTAYAPYSGTIFDLASGELIHEEPPVPIEKPERPEVQTPAVSGEGHAAHVAEVSRGHKEKHKNKITPAYSDLLDAGAWIQRVIEQNIGGANKDLKAFTKDLEKLCRKYER